MVVGVIAVLIGILLPALSRSRESARAVGCLANLRQMFVICQSYANDHDGVGPAIGQPYAAPPNWALVIQRDAGRRGTTAAALYSTNSILVCPTSQSTLGGEMTRTYAMNATGHAGAAATAHHPPDPDNFDDPTNPAHIRFDRVRAPSTTALLLDSAPAPVTGNAPPQSRTTSVIDFRNPAHLPARLGFVHGTGASDSGRFHWAAFDGSASPGRDIDEQWTHPLP